MKVDWYGLGRALYEGEPTLWGLAAVLLRERQHWLSRLREVLRKMPRPLNVMLDIGCGAATALRLAGRLSRDAWLIALDVESRYLAKLRKRFDRETRPRLLIICAALPKPSFKPRCVDFVISIAVLEYVRPLIDSIKEMWRVARRTMVATFSSYRLAHKLYWKLRLLRLAFCLSGITHRLVTLKALGEVFDWDEVLDGGLFYVCVKHRR